MASPAFTHFVADDSQPSFSHFIPDGSGPVPPDLTANPKGEGTYAMWNDSGQKLGIPYSQVPVAAQKGYQFDTNPIQDVSNPSRNGLTPAQAFAKDQVTDPAHVGGTSLFMGGTPASTQDYGTGLNLVGGVAKGMGTMATPVLDLGNLIAKHTGGNPVDINAMLAAHGAAQTIGKFGTIGATVVPSAIANPVGTATALAGGAVGGGVGHVIGNASGMSPEATAVLSDALGLAGGIGGAKLGDTLGPLVRSAAIGNPDVPLTRGLGITARTKTGLSALQSAGEAAPNDVSLEEAQGARPYGVGAQNLADLQDKLTTARTEINAPLNTALNVTANRPVMGPDGPTTISDLESQRSELSAQLRGLQQKDPLAVQTALQKGLGEADLKAKYNAIVDAMTPVLDSTGIDSKGIRMQDAQVASIYSKVAGRTTLPEQPQHYGLGKLQDLANFGGGTSPLDLLKPAKTAGSAVRDILAGKPLWSGRPTDVNIQQGFSSSGPKPDFGTPSPNFQQPPLQLGQGAPTLPEVPLQDVPQSGPAINIAPDTRAARLGLLLKAPPIELPGGVDTQAAPTYAGSSPSRLGRLLPASTDDQNIPLSEKVDIFPNQLPGAKRIGPQISPRLADILKRTGR